MNAHASYSPRLLFTLVVTVLIALLAAGEQISAQDSAPAAAKDVRKSAPESSRDNTPAKRLDAMRQIARSFATVTIDQGKRFPVPLSRDPLQRWNDPTRAFSDGTLWVWRSSGRPAAVLTIEMYPTIWSFE